MSVFPYKIVDLTHTLSPSIPSWDGGCGFKHNVSLDYDDCTSAVKFRVQHINMFAGIGTHIDAPAHCMRGGACVSELDLNDLIAPCVIINVSEKCHESYKVSLKDIQEHEEKYGTIEERSCVMIYTGWDKHWHDPKKYHNNYLFPSVLKEVADYLLLRHCVGLGIDTLSPDVPESGYPVHEILLGHGKYILENVANLKNMPAVGGFTLALPIKIQGGTEAPMRLIGLVNR